MDRGIWRGCWAEQGEAMERGGGGRWEAEATPLDIREEAPLEVVSEAHLELEGEREQMWGNLAVGVVASSYIRGLGVC